MNRATFTVLLVAGLLALAPPALAARFGAYDGPDAGQVVLSIAAATSDHNTVEIRPAGTRTGPGSAYYHLGHRFEFTEPGERTKEFLAMQAGPSLHPHYADFTGYVEAMRLPPGQYEVWSVSARMGLGFYVTSREVIPFEVLPGQTTYLGEFRMTPINSGPLGQDARWRIDLNDRSARDMPIARKKLGLPADSPVIIAPVAGRRPE